MKVSVEEIEAHDVKFFPVIRAFADKIGLVSILNSIIPSEMDVSPGIIFLGMIMDTLSGRSPLYRLDEFFENQDTELLLGEKISSEKFADYNVGRVLDKAYESGTQKIFSEVSLRAVNASDINPEHVSFDTTSFNVFGEYIATKPFDITYGHSKDHRSDLKQFLISMLCVDGNIPIMGSCEDGNASDKALNNQILTGISKHMAKHGLELDAFTYIADSAVVKKENLALLNDKRFITRLPANYKECQRVITESVNKNEWVELGTFAETPPSANRPAVQYKSQEAIVTLYEQAYRALVVHSSSHDRRRQKRIDRTLSKERKQLSVIAKESSKQNYYCRKDAKEALGSLLKTKTNYFEISGEIQERPRYKKGRPRKGGIKQLNQMEYGFEIKILENEAKVENFRKEAGCFVLLTSIKASDYNAYSILKTYKNQYGIEQNFGFLKDPAIVNAIFLDKPERIEVLGLVLLLSLLLWRLFERAMRTYIKVNNTTIPGWKGRPTKKPTAFMMTTKFLCVIVLKTNGNRILSKKLSQEQICFLNALGVSQDCFLKPK